MLSVMNADGTTADGFFLIDEIVREGARRMLAAALEAEVNAYIVGLADQRDEEGHRLVVRNGYHQLRKVTTAAGVVEVEAPRVNSRHVNEATGERKRFSSAILPPWCLKSLKISEVLPLLYLHGLSSGDFVPVLEQFLGNSAGLSPAAVTRLMQQWQADHSAFMDRDLVEVDYVYVWADGIHLNVRLEETKACVLVLVGVRADGSKELVALKDGYRKPGESWADLLRDYNAEDKQHAQGAVKTFAQLYGAKFPKAVKKITDGEAELLAFFDFPAEHWIHLRTTNPIESTFSTVRLRTKVNRGAGSRTAALAMVFKLVESAQQRWRAVNVPHLVALVRAGARFERGQLVERPGAVAA
ncbi:transposase [Streptomyces sp. NPDC088341]|uniref:transposase n=1 Tax=Streptomyces sp. NPDC088341 TaxID=3154870 RepID=UPI0034341DB8